MRWSRLKARIEERFAPNLHGRVEIFVTRYRAAHDQAGEAFILVDSERIASMGEIAYWRHRLTLERRLQQERGCADWRDPAQAGGYRAAAHEAQRTARDNEVYSDAEVKDALFASLSLSIDAALASEDPIMRAFALLDRRLGKRRLAALDVSQDTALARRFHALRCDAEGLRAPTISFAPDLRAPAADGQGASAASFDK